VKVITNTALAARWRRRATVLSLVGLGILAAGFVLNLRPGGVLYAYLALLFGSALSWLGIALADRWVRPPRAEVVLPEALGGAGPGFSLYNWVLPADHVLVAPWGIVLLAALKHDGSVVVEGERWRDTRPIWLRLLRVARPAVRNPAPVLETEEAALRAALAEAGGDEPADVSVQRLAVFLDPRVELTLKAPTLPVVRIDELRGWLRGEGKRPPLSPTERRKLEQALDRLAEQRMAEDPPARSATGKPGANSAKKRVARPHR
jgi:hypothetical protein